MLPYSLDSMLIGIIFIAAALWARQLFNLNLWIYRKIGLVSLAEFWNRQRGWWLPAMRTVIVAFAVIFFAQGAGII
jgi:hypothetical protein